MITRRVGSFSELNVVLRRDMKARKERIDGAIKRTAKRGATYVRANMPVAFGELQDATVATATAIQTEAPHAGAVESGSRPHWVPLDALIKWVKLRGMQGLKSTRQLAKQRGTTTFNHARAVAAEIRNRMLTDSPGDAVAADAPEQIARAIQVAIAKGGTKPHWYMRNAIPVVQAYLDEEIKAIMPDED